MAKWVTDEALDAMLANIATSTRMVACSGQPANFAGIAAVALADITLTAGHGNGDYTIGNGDTSGRKVNIAQQSAVTIDASGDATHVSLDDGSELRYVTTCNTLALTEAGTVTFPTWDIEVADPT